MFAVIFLEHDKKLVKYSVRTLLIVYKTIHHLKRDWERNKKKYIIKWTKTEYSNFTRIYHSVLHN